MSTKAYKVNVIIETPSGTIASDNISITHSINDIPVAAVSVVPRTAAEIELFGNLEKNLFKEFKITTIVNGDTSLALSGQFVGLETNASASGIREVVNVRGGLYKLTQMGTLMPGLHLLGEHSMRRLSLNSAIIKSMYLTNQSPAKTKNNIIEVFQETLNRLFAAVTSATPAKPNDPSGFYGPMGKALESLYKFHSTQGKSVLTTEFKKIKIAAGLDSTAYNTWEPEKIKDIVSSISGAPGSTFWNVLIALCEKYQIHLGTYSDKIFAVPANQVGEPSIEISPEDITSVAVSPFPIFAPTRCLFSVSGDSGQAWKNIPAGGMFPSIDKADKPTKFEEKIGAIRAITYTMPGFALHRKGIASPVLTNIFSDPKGNASLGLTYGGAASMSSALFAKIAQQNILQTIKDDHAQMKKQKEEDDMFAQTYLAKETFKHRTGSLSLRYSPNVPVGLVAKFKDPVYKKSYQGYITRVTHNISSSSIGTDITMQYVIGDKEKEFLGLDTGGYMGNMIYPNYKAGDLKKLLGI